MATKTPRKRYVEVPAERLLEELSAIGKAVEGVGGQYQLLTVGREVVVYLVPPKAPAKVCVYTSLTTGAKVARGCGEDAVRVVVASATGKRSTPLEEGQKVLRTAPRGLEDRVAAFLVRLRGELREAYKRACNTPTCPKCRAAMAVRKAKKTGRPFYGCSTYPECSGILNP